MSVTILTGDCRAQRNERGQFLPGTHWREDQPFRHRDWLMREYVEAGRSAGDIAREFSVTDAAILFWLKKHGIPRRTVAEARSLKHWGVSGDANPMYGKTGDQNGNWKGGITAERQAFYASLAWVECVKTVWSRDRATCRRCGEKAVDRGKFHIHHITPFSVKELRAKPSNLILLCPGCHRWVHSKANVNQEFIEQERRLGE